MTSESLSTHRIRQFTLLLVALCVGAVPAATAQGFLRRQGTQIVNDGGPVMLRGINLGNWLFNESYMTGAPFDHYAWPAALKDVLGTDANVASFYTAWRTNYIGQADIQRLKALGFNSVRVPLDYALFYNTTTGQLRNDNWVWLDNLLAWCANAGVYAILDMHGSPAQAPGHYPLFADTAKRAVLAQVWTAIANRYASNPWIGGFDLLNEPLLDVQSEKWRLRDVYVQLTTAIRGVDTNHLIFAEGNYYGADLWDLDPRWDENMAFSIHNYWTPIPTTGALGIVTQVNLANAENLPLWLGEFGENSDTWINAQRRDVEGRGVGWAVWPYKTLTSRIQCATWVGVTPGYQAVIDYWNGAGPKPSQSAALASLLDIAQRTARATCTENPEFLDAVLRADFHTTRLPFAQLTSSSRIYAADYDMGAQSVASNDSVWQVTDQSGTPWNNGWLHRNDGVDLGYLDDNGNRSHVGWTDAGEWVAYTVATAPGTPSLNLRYSAPSSCNVHVEIDGVNVTGAVALPSTGGWFNWTTRNIATTANLSAGLHSMKIFFDNGGVNFYWIEFAGLPAVVPSPWTVQDVGGPRRVGYAFYDSGMTRWSLGGGGADIWNASDQFQFAARTLTGDGVIVARVVSVSNTDPWAKAGVMLRESLNAGAKNVLLALTPGHGVTMQWRDTAGGASTAWGTSGDAAPFWLRLARSGNTFFTHKSGDGTTWTPWHSTTLAMPATIQAGLAVSAHNDALLNAATFDNVSVSTLPPGFSSFAAFQSAHFNTAQLADPNVSGATADANADGIANLLAYASGLSPWTAATAANAGRVVGQIQNGYFTVTFARLRTALDVRYDVEVSGNLATWNSGAAFTTQVSVTPLDATREQVTVRDNTPLASAARRAMRVRVSSD